MAVIRFLHWNIEQCSLRKITMGNGAQIVNYIARVAAQVNANMISIIEVKRRAAATLTANLVPAIQMAKGNANAWNAVVSSKTNNNEVYYLLWETGNNFTTLASAAIGGPNPNQGYTLDAVNPPPAQLRFPNRSLQWGGRRPYFATFHTTDTGHDFSVIVYHAMFGRHTARGVRSVGRLRSVQQVDDGMGNLVMMDASIVAGDFNVDFITFPGDYNNLVNLVGAPAAPPGAGAASKTSLVVLVPAGGFANSLLYRVNAYDNIFASNAGMANQGVIDLLVQSATLAGVAGFLVPVITNFNVAFMGLLPLLLHTAPPPQDLEDSWRIVAHQVSNHLPVTAALTI